MFLEDEDWNDDRGAEVLSSTKPKVNCSLSVKTKVVGKKSLLRTLQMLGSVPDWSEQPQHDSDSEAETHPTEHAHKKRKKRRKRKHAETTVEQTENGDLSQKGTEDTAVVKKKNQKDKFGKKRTFTTTDETYDQETPKPAKVELGSPEKQRSRQQWKNKMKNKRKCKNKFKSNPTAQEVQKEDAESNCDVANKERESKEVKNNVEKPEIDKEVTEGKQNDRPVKITKTISDENRVVIKDKHIELAQHQESELRKKHNLKKEKLRKLLQSQSPEQKQEVVVVVPDVTVNLVSPDPPVPRDASASLRTKMEQRLESARFRYINEVLYSSTSREAKRMFTQDPQAFWVYHRGYSAQVQRWPTNPVDNIIHFIQTRPRSHVVADFGCGDCKIAQSIRNKVHSFDLVATCDLVTACDMANVPLKNSSVDIAVFCLSLMGTNLADFIKEANRVLKMGGVLKIAEVSSRFDNVKTFIAALARLGFKLVLKDTENTHFYSFDFVKTGPAPDSVKSGLQLKPCVYKKR